MDFQSKFVFLSIFLLMLLLLLQNLGNYIINISELKDNKIMEKYMISESFTNVSRKKAQNLAVDNKKRLGYANIQG
jgi:hypothetical protein